MNTSNLFYISERDAKDFTDIDEMLNGSTLYQLFQNQVRIQFKVKPISEAKEQE